MTLTVEHLTGGYNNKKIINDLNFTVEDGEVVALIGPNGAGKSTTIKHLIGLLKPFSGDVKINGSKLIDNVNKYHAALSYVPEAPILYDDLTLAEHIKVIELAYSLNEKNVQEQAQSYLTTFGLANKLDWFPSKFSKGMKQKVMITCSFITNANIYIMDEPFSGLDPFSVVNLINLIEEKKQKNKSILMSTHNMNAAERYADKFILLNHGTIIAQGTLSEVRAQLQLEETTSLEEIYLLTMGGQA